MRGMAVLAAGALLWGVSAGPAGADSIRDGQWPLMKYAADRSVWPLSEGAGVTVAVIDSGVSDHQDLAGQVLPGADFSGGGSQGHDDATGHGTGMSSLIAGHGHGGQAGIMGLAPKAKILPVKVGLTDGGDFSGGQETRLAEAIRYATDHGAKVINMSIAGPLGHDTAARDAVKYAVGKDVVLVAGAGNLGQTDDSRVQYPAAFPGVVAVGAVDQQGNLWPGSNRGPELTLVAPGVDIYRATAKSTSSYGKGTGTSDATAYVSAVAALVRAKYPALSAGQVINRIIKSAVAPPDNSKVPGDGYGYGIASPSRALAADPAVDNGPKENPLLTRPESQGGPATGPGTSSTAPMAAGSSGKSGGGISAVVYAAGGVLALLVVVGAVLLLRRRSGRGTATAPGGYQPPAPAGPAPGQPGAQAYQQPYQQPYQQAVQQPGQPPYQQPYQQNPYSAQPPQQYPPQAPQNPPAPPGNPYS
ncbi:hypothetical protein GCM10009760_30960 [Kitasatospora kazusensis]|uniref:Peptidase S8/S53 domain-containing protein n=1 Tax=Kitasatospora kazusensis TaxID=407974 RepID=A0ABN2ZL81_9ACTN